MQVMASLRQNAPLCFGQYEAFYMSLDLISHSIIKKLNDKWHAQVQMNE